MPTPRTVENEMLPAMVAWFKESYPEIAPLLVYCPRVTRGNRRMERRGTYGCAELILLYPNKAYSCLCVQVLNASERNSDLHKQWRATVEHAGCKCVTLRNLVNFVNEIEDYLLGTPYA